MRDLSAVFEPKTIAIIGANANPLSVTNMTFLQQLPISVSGPNLSGQPSRGPGPWD